jgi:two-component system LytT family response regulator
MTMEVLIIEDEKLAADRLAGLLYEYDKSIKILNRLDSIKASVHWFKTNKSPDLVFMDIQLADGLSFEIFDNINISIPVIFTTAFSDYAIKAFKVNSIDYLLKPLEPACLKTALDKLKTLNLKYKLVNSDSLKEVRESILEQEYKKRYVVKLGIHLHSLSVNDITCFFSKEKGTCLHTKDNKRYSIDYSLEQIESDIEPKIFFRINRKYIVNINYIEDIIHYSNSRLKVVIKNLNEEDVIVSREKVQDFKSWLDK